MELLTDPQILASELDAEIQGLAHRYTPDIRSIRRAYPQKIKSAKPEYVLEFARQLLLKHGCRRSQGSIPQSWRGGIGRAWAGDKLITGLKTPKPVKKS